MKTDGAPVHGSYFDLLEAKHPDLQRRSLAAASRIRRPRPARRRRRVGPLLVVAIGVLAGVAWLAIALRAPLLQWGGSESAQMAALPAVESPAVAQLPPAPVEAPGSAPVVSKRPEPKAVQQSTAPSRQELREAHLSPSPPGSESEVALQDAPPARPQPALPAESTPQPQPPRRPGAGELRPRPAEAAVPPPAPAALLPPRAISSPSPEYPEGARLAGDEGTVVVRAEIDTAGAVTGTTVVRGVSPSLDRAAAEALGKWRFEPATRGGVAVASSHRVGFRFALEAAAEPEPSVPLEVGGDVQPPRRLEAPLPTYPDAAWAAGISGDVLVKAVIDETGAVRDVEVLRGLPHGVTEAAVKAIRRWKFAPATRNGRPVAVYQTLSVRFEP